MDIFNLPAFVNRTVSFGEKETVIVAPETWSDNACMILYTKYFRKAGVPTRTSPVKEQGIPSWLQRRIPSKDSIFGPETSAKQVFNRLAGAWTYHGLKEGYFTSKEAKPFYDKIFAMLANQVAAPNSPQWFSTGLWWAYGIEGEPSGGYYIGKNNEAVEAPNSYQYNQASACFINRVEDDLLSEDGIMNLWTKEARLFKYGSGSGVNYSALRGLDEPLSHGGKSSGLMSFLKVGDASAGAIKSGGTTRRAARMVVVDVDHPDVEAFIDWKMKEETKVAMLDAGSKAMQNFMYVIKAEQGKNDITALTNRDDILEIGQDMNIPLGFVNRVINAIETNTPLPVVEEMNSTDWQSEAYQTVSGQNANNSISVSHEFMRALDANGYWGLANRTDGLTNKVLMAQDLWNKICYAAWSCADPGLIFTDTMNDWHTAPKLGKINSTNPCGEYNSIDNTSCNLASQNLKMFINDKGEFDVNLFIETTELLTIVLDITVGMSQYPAKKIAEQTAKIRNLGLGYANVGGLLMHMGIPYDSPEGRYLIAGITAVMHSVSLNTSSKLGKKLGAFPAYVENIEAMHRVVYNHKTACSRYLMNKDEGDDYDSLVVYPYIEYATDPVFATKYKSLFNTAMVYYNSAYVAGEFRNSQNLTIAPTGCTLSTTRIKTSDGVKSYREIMDENGVDYKKIEEGNEKRWFALKEFTLPSYENKTDYSDKIWYNGRQETYVINFADGTEFECTGNHKLLVKIFGTEIWVEAQHLQGNEEIVSY